MGIGSVGVGDPNVVFLRKNRYTLDISSQPNSNCTPFQVPPYFVKVASLPNISFEETEIHWMNDKMWLPGKATWESITVTYMNVAGSVFTGSNTGGGANQSLFQWLVNVFNFTSPAGSSATPTGLATYKSMGSKVNDYTGVATIIMYDGCGHAVQTWTLADAWPQAINFGDLANESSDTVDIEVTLRYSKVQWTQNCPAATLTPCCSPCS